MYGVLIICVLDLVMDLIDEEWHEDGGRCFWWREEMGDTKKGEKRGKRACIDLLGWFLEMTK